MKTGVASVLVVAASLAASAAWAGYPEFVAKAHKSIEQSQDAVEETGAACKKAVTEKLEAVAESVAELRHLQAPSRIDKSTALLSQLGMSAVLAGCPNAVSDPVREASEALGYARALKVRELADADGASASKEDGHDETPVGMGQTEFDKLMKAVHDTKDEVAKGEVVKNAVGHYLLSAQQLGKILDEMGSDLIKQELVDTIADKVVDPKNGALLASHFDDSQMGAEAVATLKAQPGHMKSVASAGKASK